MTSNASPNLIWVHTSLIPEILQPSCNPGENTSAPASAPVQTRRQRADGSAARLVSVRRRLAGWMTTVNHMLIKILHAAIADQAVAEALVAVFAASSAHFNDNSNSLRPTDEDAEDALRSKRQRRKAPRAAEEERRDHEHDAGEEQ
ncbi:hypothetical protein C8R46DRAFT_1215302 [Mycena filopes]|nr:hypothetical protein C8R46DRAFT_1215302 [Mycena filopes]